MNAPISEKTIRLEYAPNEPFARYTLLDANIARQAPNLRHTVRRGRFHDTCDTKFDRIRPDILEPAISTIQRITCQAVMESGKLTDHEHLAVTERNRGSSPSDRQVRESFAMTTGGASFQGDSPAVGDC